MTEPARLGEIDAPECRIESRDTSVERSQMVEELITQRANALAAARREALMAEIEKAARALMLAVDACLPHIDGQFALHQIRTGVVYKGPTLGVELEALRALLVLPCPPARASQESTP